MNGVIIELDVHFRHLCFHENL